tara:strand:+ start:340 stop:900 length:561 start_codon:yes stop_codon:yes gene_type:complete
MELENCQDANAIFDLLGVKDVTTKRQEKNGTIVYELPFERCSTNGTTGKIKFACYESGYIRDVSDWNSSCWQINKKYEAKEKVWNSYYKKYFTHTSYKRVLIDDAEDRIVYLANYILKNYYRNPNKFMIGEWTKECIESQYEQASKYRNQNDKLPFEIDVDGDYIFDYGKPKDVQVIINGHRYNLS